MRADYEPKGKRTTQKHCTLVDKVLSNRGRGLTILTLFYIHIGIEELSKWMADTRSQVSHCWEWEVADKRGRRLE